MPLLGLVFLGLAIVDLVGRFAGFLYPPILIVGISDPLNVLTQVIPRALIIVLPAFIVGRYPSTARTGPLVLRGAVLVAIAELVAPLALRVSFETLTPQNLYVWTSLLFLWALAKAAAWVTIGIGLRSLAPPEPSPQVVRFANVVAGAIGAGALVQLVQLLTGQAAASQAATASGGIHVLGWTFFVLESLALAFVARTVILGLGDIRRPALATRVAVAAFSLLGVVALIDITLAIATVAWYVVGPFLVLGYGSGDVGTSGGGWINWFSFPILGGWTPSIATSAFLVSFAFGLADEPSEPASIPPAPVEPGRLRP